MGNHASTSSTIRVHTRKANYQAGEEVRRFDAVVLRWGESEYAPLTEGQQAAHGAILNASPHFSCRKRAPCRCPLLLLLTPPWCLVYVVV